MIRPANLSSLKNTGLYIVQVLFLSTKLVAIVNLYLEISAGFLGDIFGPGFHISRESTFFTPDVELPRHLGAFDFLGVGARQRHRTAQNCGTGNSRYHHFTHPRHAFFLPLWFGLFPCVALTLSFFIASVNG